MKIKSVIINTSDSIGGAARSAYRLHKGILACSENSTMLVQHKLSDDNSVQKPAFFGSDIITRFRQYIDELPLVLNAGFKKTPYSLSFAPDVVRKYINRQTPDLVHLHWICHSFVNIRTVGRIRSPILWTLHDSWPFTGGCHIHYDCIRYKNTCGKCPQLGAKRENDLSRWVWHKKRKAWETANITVVTPSNWLAACARESSLFCDRRVQVIPNGIDTEKFKPINKNTARNILGLSNDKYLIAFGALSALRDRNKGNHFLDEILSELEFKYNKKFEMVVFGSSAPSADHQLNYPVTYMGTLHDEISMTLLYSAVDVFLLPSLSENLPNTVMESLSCGTPVVAFNIGGNPDMIDHKKNGYLAKPYDPADLARGISWVLEDKERWKLLSKNARTKVVREFAIEKVARRYVELYREILGY